MPPGLQEFLEGISAWAGLLWVTFALTALVVVGRALFKAWPGIKKFIALIDALIALPDFMERIRHQVENDHDTNLRDEVTQLLDMTSDMSTQLAGVVTWQAAHEKKSDRAYARISALEKKENG